MKILNAIAGITFLGITAVAGAADTAVVSKCGDLDLTRFWLPQDMEFAMDDFIAKARSINNSGTCVVDGWFGRNENKFYMTVVPPGYSRIGRVVSFTLMDLRDKEKK